MIYIMKSYLFLANGFEEIEAISTIDILRRANMEVVTISITGAYDVQGAHGVNILADKLFTETDFTDAAWLILPGGLPGAANLADYKPLTELLIKQNELDGGIAAICAAPALVLGAIGLLDNKVATCYPGFEDKMLGAKNTIEPIVVDGNIITANGPATAFKFALAIISEELGESTAQEVASGMLLYPQQPAYYF